MSYEEGFLKKSLMKRKETVMMDIDRAALEQWQKHQPLAILQLDPSDRVVLRVAGRTYIFYYNYLEVVKSQKVFHFGSNLQKKKVSNYYPEHLLCRF